MRAVIALHDAVEGRAILVEKTTKTNVFESSPESKCERLGDRLIGSVFLLLKSLLLDRQQSGGSNAASIVLQVTDVGSGNRDGFSCHRRPARGVSLGMSKRDTICLRPMAADSSLTGVCYLMGVPFVTFNFGGMRVAIRA